MVAPALSPDGLQRVPNQFLTVSPVVPRNPGHQGGGWRRGRELRRSETLPVQPKMNHAFFLKLNWKNITINKRKWKEATGVNITQWIRRNSSTVSVPGWKYHALAATKSQWFLHHQIRKIQIKNFQEIFQKLVSDFPKGSQSIIFCWW